MRAGIVAVAALSLLYSTGAFAEAITARQALEALNQKTWSGKNAKGETFWFWHDGDGDSGKFAARFSTAAKRVHRGAWKRKGETACWDWPSFGQTFCYVEFKKVGDTISMTRSDGVVHAGKLSAVRMKGL